MLYTGGTYQSAFHHYNKRDATCRVMKWLMVLETQVHNWAALLV